MASNNPAGVGACATAMGADGTAILSGAAEVGPMAASLSCPEWICDAKSVSTLGSTPCTPLGLKNTNHTEPVPVCSESIETKQMRWEEIRHWVIGDVEWD